MTKDFLTWTRENEEYTSAPFMWKELDNGHLKALTTGVLEFIPHKKTKKQLVYSCAIHGNETAPIEILRDFIKSLECGELIGMHHTLFIFGNPRSINIEKRFSTENLNRLFARELESKEENYEVKRAKEIISIMDQFFIEGSKKFHYDLHTAIKPSVLPTFAIYPYSPDQEVNKEQLGFLEKSGIEAVVFNQEKATTFSYHSSSRYGAASFTLELGKVKKFGENNRADFIKIETSLRQLFTGTYEESESISTLKLFQIDLEIIKADESFHFGFDQSLPNFSRFSDGDLISKDQTTEVRAKGEHQRMIFPNEKVRIGERAALIIGPKSLPL